MFYNRTCMCNFLVYLLILSACNKPDHVIVTNSQESFAEKGLPESGTFKISPVGETREAISLASTSQDNNVFVQLKNYDKDSAIHLWRFAHTGQGFFRISNAYSGRVLTSDGVNGSALYQSRYDTSDNQLWVIKRVNEFSFSIQNKAHGLWITLEINGQVTGRLKDPSLEQIWKLSPVDAIYVDVDAENFFRRTKGWIASDGAASTLMNDGRVAWFMGDSHIDDYFENTQKVYCLFPSAERGIDSTRCQ